MAIPLMNRLCGSASEEAAPIFELIEVGMRSLYQRYNHIANHMLNLLTILAGHTDRPFGTHALAAPGLP